jgi:MoxR-like ATPase
MNSLKPRIVSLLQQLNERVFEKEHVVALSLLSAVAGESIFLLGPPGVAKSMVARRLKLAFRNASAFEYLMSRFSTPDEIFGPVSISKLKDKDTYERIVDGYLPSATIAFLDEIWKAGPAIQNALLTIINEKIYRNGQFSIHVPLKGLVAASNELPAQGQGLEALWDRFLLRCLVSGIEDMGEFDRMISSTDESEPVVDESLQITDEEYIQWEKEIAAVKIHYSIFEIIHALKDKIEQYNLQVQNEGGISAPLYVSDRRWKKMIKLLKTSAFLNGSDTIRLSDCTLLAYCLWSEIDQMEIADEMVSSAIQKSAEGYLLNIKGLEQDIDELKDRQSSEHSLREVNDPGIQIVDTYYYQIEGVRMKERLLIFAADYQHLDKTGKLFYLHKDKYKANCCILKKYDAILHAKVPRDKMYTLKRGTRSVYINNYEYHLMCYEDCAPPPPEPEPEDLGAKYRSVAEAVGRAEKDWSELMNAETEYYEQHLFLGEKQRGIMRRMLRHQKNNIDRYKNDLNELGDAYRKENQEYKIEKPENDLFS